MNFIFANYISKLPSPSLAYCSNALHLDNFHFRQPRPHLGGHPEVPQRRLRGGAGERGQSGQSPQNAERQDLPHQAHRAIEVSEKYTERKRKKMYKILKVRLDLET